MEQQKSPLLKNKLDNFLSKPKETNINNSKMITNAEFIDSIMQQNEFNTHTNNDIDHTMDEYDSHLEENNEIKEYTIIIPKKTELDEIIYQPDYFHSIGFDVDIFLSNDSRNKDGIQSTTMLGGSSITESISLPYKYFTYFLNQRLAPIPINKPYMVNDNSIAQPDDTKPSLFKQFTDQIQSFFNTNNTIDIKAKAEPIDKSSIEEILKENSLSAETQKSKEEEQIEQEVSQTEEPQQLSWILKIKSKHEPILIENADSGKLIYEEKEDVLDEILEQMYHQKKYGVYMKSQIYKIDDRYILLGDVVKDSTLPIDFFGTSNPTKPGTKLHKYLKFTA